MAKRISFHRRQHVIIDIVAHHRDLVASLRLYFSVASPTFTVRFLGYDQTKVAAELIERLDEIDLTSTMSILTALEAAFRIDYLRRVYTRRRDVLSRAFREVYQTRKEMPRLEDDIFKGWRDNSCVPQRLISELRGAFKFRHWMAHGRFWTPKHGRQYDFNYIFSLASAVFENFPFYGLE